MEESSVIQETTHLPQELKCCKCTMRSFGCPPLPPRPSVPSEPTTWPRPPNYEPGTTTTCITTRSQDQDYRSELLEAGPAAAARASCWGPLRLRRGAELPFPECACLALRKSCAFHRLPT